MTRACTMAPGAMRLAKLHLGEMFGAAHGFGFDQDLARGTYFTGEEAVEPRLRRLARRRCARLP